MSTAALMLAGKIARDHAEAWIGEAYPAARNRALEHMEEAGLDTTDPRLLITLDLTLAAAGELLDYEALEAIVRAEINKTDQQLEEANRDPNTVD